MRDVSGKTAFVTGGAGGIGLALAKMLLLRGASVMLADIEAAALETGVRTLAAISPNVDAVVCDVAVQSDVSHAAAAAKKRFGQVQILCNNAGVSRAGQIERVAESDWQWVIGVNLMGVVHGLQAFLPEMKASGEECHIVNTSSMKGIVGGVLSGPYAATKFGIVGISEVLAAELTNTPIGVSVLCPSWVKTQMPNNGRNRPDRFGGPFDLNSDVENAERNERYLAAAESGLDPDEVAAMVFEAMTERRLYVFTHPEQRHEVEHRNAVIASGFDAADAWAVHGSRSSATDAIR